MKHKNAKLLRTLRKEAERLTKELGPTPYVNSAEYMNWLFRKQELAVVAKRIVALKEAQRGND